MVKVTDDYYIEVESSPLQYTLKRLVPQKKQKDDAKPRYRALGYYTSAEGALKAVVDQVVADDLSEGLYTLSEALAHIVEQRKELRRVIDEAFAYPREGRDDTRK